MGLDCVENGDGDKLNHFKSDTGFKVSRWGYRHQQSLILFFTMTVAYSMRSCMGVALVAMVAKDDVISGYNKTMADQAVDNGTIVVSVNEAEELQVEGVLNALMLVPPYPKFTWNKKVQDTVISSFFWGYMLLQIPAGQLAHRFGARYILIFAMASNSIFSIILPFAAYYGGWTYATVCRFGQGLSQACIFPSFHTFFGRWAPLHERGRLTTLTYGGQALGTVLELPITGFISSPPLGWPGIFRVYGVFSGIIAAVLWMIADTPAKHPRISDEERRYIEDGLESKDSGKRLAVPWIKILQYRGVYAIIFAHIGQTWGHIILYSEVPAFMDNIMGLNIKANGLLTALPFLVMWVTNFFFSWLTDMLIVKNILSVTKTRKFANSLGGVPAAIGLIVLAYAPKNIYIIESILIFICAFKVSGHLGFQVNHIDISPNFAGTIMSLSNFVSNLVGSLAPTTTGIILTDVTNEYLWRKVFFVSAGLLFFTNLVYVILGTAEKADWNEPPEETQNNIVEENLPMIEAPEKTITII